MKQGIVALRTAIDFELPAEVQKLADTAWELAPQFRERAREYDKGIRSQKEDFADLAKAGLLSITVPRSMGGHGLGASDSKNPLGMWAITKALAYADLCLARNWENHVNTIDTMTFSGCSLETQRRWCAKTVENGAVWSNWAAEPPKSNPDGSTAYIGQTLAEKVDGGWKVNGKKRYANTATAADVTCVWVMDKAADNFFDGILMLMTDTHRPEIKIEDWWDAMGMRASDAQEATFQNAFIPDADQVGAAGAFFKMPAWSMRAVPHYAVSFLGATEAIFDWTIEYVQGRGKGRDQFVRHHLGQMHAAIEACNALLKELGKVWARGDEAAIRTASISFRIMAERTALEVAAHAIKACGSTAFHRQYEFERMYRDIQVYVRHENIDHMTSNLGALCAQADVHTYWTPGQVVKAQAES